MYHFDKTNHVDALLTNLDKNKVFANIVIKRGPTQNQQAMTMKIVKKKTKPKDDEIEQNIAANQSVSTNQPTNEGVPNSTATVIDENLVKVHYHIIKPCNLLALKATFRKYKINLPSKNYCNHKINTTTLAFTEKNNAEQFLQSLPLSLDQKHHTNCINRRDQSQDWNVVIRGIDTEIDIAGLESTMAPS